MQNNQRLIHFSVSQSVLVAQINMYILRIAAGPENGNEAFAFILQNIFINITDHKRAIDEEITFPGQDQNTHIHFTKINFPIEMTRNNNNLKLAAFHVFSTQIKSI